MAERRLYLAPEVAAGGPATVQSDVYSLGVLLRYALTGSYAKEGRPTRRGAGRQEIGRCTDSRNRRVTARALRVGWWVLGCPSAPCTTAASRSCRGVRRCSAGAVTRAADRSRLSWLVAARWRASVECKATGRLNIRPLWTKWPTGFEVFGRPARDGRVLPMTRDYVHIVLTDINLANIDARTSPRSSKRWARRLRGRFTCRPRTFADRGCLLLPDRAREVRAPNGPSGPCTAGSAAPRGGPIADANGMDVRRLSGGEAPGQGRIDAWGAGSPVWRGGLAHSPGILHWTLEPFSRWEVAGLRRQCRWQPRASRGVCGWTVRRRAIDCRRQSDRLDPSHVDARRSGNSVRQRPYRFAWALDAARRRRPPDRQSSTLVAGSRADQRCLDSHAGWSLHLLSSDRPGSYRLGWLECGRDGRGERRQTCRRDNWARR